MIRMLCVRGLPARFHAIYGDSELVVEVSPLRIVGGSVPNREAEMVLTWAKAHQHELLEAWKACRLAHRPAPIAPLI